MVVSNMDTCVCCGAPVPEGRQVCPICESRSYPPDAILQDGTPIYLKTTNPHIQAGVQLALYDLLMGYKRAVQKED